MRILAGLMLLVVLTTPAWAGRIALVVGNDGYRNVMPLERAVADARAFRDHLRDVRGFDVVYVEDGDRATIAGSLTLFLSRIEAGDTALVYYAGHALQADPGRSGSLYLLPVDFPEVGSGRNGDDGFLTTHAVDFGEILAGVAARRAALRIAVFDACRDNPFAGARAAGQGGAAGRPAATTPEGGDFAIFSAAPGACPLERIGTDDEDPNSLFARVFLGFFQPGAGLEAVMNRTQAKVLELSRGAGHPQVPYYTDGVPGTACIEESCAE